jgi:hypothetical protein
MKWRLITRAMRRAPSGLLGMLVLVTFTDRFVARHDVDFSNATAANWRYSEREARRQTDPGLILCFGSSLVKYGVLPRLIEEATRRQAFNLAVCNGHMPSSYYLLKRSLDSGARPAALVVDCQDGPVARVEADRQAEALRVNLRQWPELLSWREGIDLAWTARDANFFADWALSRLLPSYKARFEIRSSVVATLRGASGSSRFDVMAVRRNWALNEGAQVMPRGTVPPADLPSTEPFDAARAAESLRASCKRNELTELYIDRFLSLAASHNLPVFWVLPPLAPAHQADRDRAGMSHYFSQQAESARAKYVNVTVVDARRSGYASSVFWDKVHLDRQGACAFTIELAGVIDRVLTVPGCDERWVSLPRYREAKLGFAIEDVMQSRATVAARSQRVLR